MSIKRPVPTPLTEKAQDLRRYTRRDKLGTLYRFHEVEVPEFAHLISFRHATVCRPGKDATE